MILTKIITTPKVQILVIGGLPEDASNPMIKLNALFWGEDQRTSFVRNMPNGKWQPIGFLKDLSEDEAKKLVENITRQDNENRYKNYLKKYGLRDNWWSISFNTAKESLLSLIESEVKLKNKYGEFPDKYNTGLSYGMEYIGKVQEWEAEQETVFTNSFIIIKK